MTYKKYKVGKESFGEVFKKKKKKKEVAYR